MSPFESLVAAWSRWMDATDEPAATVCEAHDSAITAARERAVAASTPRPISDEDQRWWAEMGDRVTRRTTELKGK